jgi:hypothetical protein
MPRSATPNTSDGTAARVVSMLYSNFTPGWNFWKAFSQ